MKRICRNSPLWTSALVFSFAILCLFYSSPCLLVEATLARSSGNTISSILSYNSIGRRRLSLIRGGSEEEEEEGDGHEETSVEISTDAKSFMNAIGNIVIGVMKAFGRVTKAAFESGKEDNNDISLVTKTTNVISRMVRAAFDFEKSPDKVEGRCLERSRSAQKMEASYGLSNGQNVDFGEYLAQSYGVPRNQLDKPAPILGGSFTDAMKLARANARLLVVFIPSSKPKKSKKRTPDQIAIQGLLSLEVSKVAEKKSRKNTETGSYYIWSAKPDSPEALTAIRRLKARQTGSNGSKRPILVVCYLQQVVDKNGLLKLIPRLLAQHHCSPPPSSEAMGSWLNTLRRRHAKQYAKMIEEKKEMHLYRERKESYQKSIVSDKDREECERKEEEHRLAQEKIEAQRTADLKRRRAKILESLPDEPAKDDMNARTIALRFADGSSAQRRFNVHCTFSTIFEWIGAKFEIEEDKLILTTLQGQKSFTLLDNGKDTLEDSGLPKMIGLRVIETDTQESAQLST